MNKLRRLIRWFIPVGYAVKMIRRANSHGCGKMVWSRGAVDLHSIWYTPFNGVYLVFSKTDYNRQINHAIDKLKKDIECLEGKLK